jgi:hypothetical protein
MKISPYLLGVLVAIVPTASLAAPVNSQISYDGNSKVTFDQIQFTFLEGNVEKHAAVSRESCYYGYTNKFTVFLGNSSSAGTQEVSANTPAKIKLVRAVCRNNPKDYGQIGGFFNNRNNLWDSK